MSETPGAIDDRNEKRLMQLAERAARKEAEAFETLVAEFQPALQRFLELRIDAQLSPRVDVTDVLQETWWEFSRRLDYFLQHRPMPLKVWLLRMAREQLRDLRVKHVQRERRAVDRSVPLPDRSSMMLSRQLASFSTPSRHLAGWELQRSVANMVSQLPESDREILLLRHVDGLSYGDISSLLEIESSAARKRYTRALDRLQAMCLEAGLWSEA